MRLGGPSHGARLWCLGRVPKHRNHLLPRGSESRAVGPVGKMNKETTPKERKIKIWDTRPSHQTRPLWLGPPRLKMAKLNFFTIHNFLHTLKNEPLNIMLLHTSRRMDGPWINDGSCCVPYFWRIFFHGARNRGLSDMLETWIGKPHPRNKSSKYAPTDNFGG